MFNGSERLKPTLNPQDITAKAAARFGELGRRLQERGHDPRAVAHFLNRLVFCMFAEDARLLPDGLFTRTLRATERQPTLATAQLADLFAKMRTGGFFGADVIRFFNGGLFDDAGVLPLEEDDLRLIVGTASEHDWSEIDPAIFGTLFEQALKATRERPALGAHYTDREKILKIVDPVIVRPLTAEWEAAKAEIAAAMDKANAAEAERKRIELEGTELLKMSTAEFRRTDPSRKKVLTAALRARTVATTEARARLETFLVRLAGFRVLDPACGSGNFLYVALHALKDLELRAIVDADRLGVPEVPPPRVGLDAVRGIEIEAYAAELARVTLWIGDLQWMRKNGYTNWQEPILSSLDQIECRDALLTRVVAADDDAAPILPGEAGEGDHRQAMGEGAVQDGGTVPPPSRPAPRAGRATSPAVRGRIEAGPSDATDGWVEAAWPEADAIIGNPPFLGDRKMASELGEAYVGRLRRTFEATRSIDFVCYWFIKAGEIARTHPELRVGLVATNSIRGGANREVLRDIGQDAPIWEAWSDEPWVIEGAAVRVSMICFGGPKPSKLQLDGHAVDVINADLTSLGADVSSATRLAENKAIAFNGVQKTGPFEVEAEQARQWLLLPLNPNNRPNSDVLRPYWNGIDLARRSRESWIIDFSNRMEAEASLYQAPFEHARNVVKPSRAASKVQRADARSALVNRWWLFWRSRPEMTLARKPLWRTIVTPEVSKHRLFVGSPGTRDRQEPHRHRPRRRHHLRHPPLAVPRTVVVAAGDVARGRQRPALYPLDHVRDLSLPRGADAEHPRRRLCRRPARRRHRRGGGGTEPASGGVAQPA